MINPQLLKENIAEVTSAIPAIVRKEVLVTDDELTEKLSEHKNTDNILLVAVLPSYGGFGEEDSAGIISYLQFFILEKVDYKKFRNSDEYIAVFERTLGAAREFLNGMFGMELLNCSREQLQYDFQIRPVSRKAQCNGYEIQIDSRAYTDKF